AVNGVDALEHLERNRYAAVLMDCQMPVMDGYEATRRLRRSERAKRRRGSGRHIPVIALTAMAMAEDRARCIGAGMDDYLTKPIKAEELAAALQRWVPVDPPTPVAGAAVAGGTAPSTVPGASDRQGIEPATEPADLDQAIIGGLRELGGPALLDELVSLFHDDVGRHLSELDRALSDHDPVAVRQTAHAIAGSSANMGATRLATAASTLEHLAATGDLEGAEALSTAIATHCRRALDALAEETGRPVAEVDGRGPTPDSADSTPSKGTT
ncbi:MAG: response regulator, partial [Acidimicrobiales bacterium]